MKKLTKTFLSVAAVSALTAAMAVSASAAVSANLDETGEVNKVVLSGVQKTGTSQTILILNEDAQVVEETMVKAIDQRDDGEVFTEIPVGDLEDGTYYVRIGGTELVDGTIQEATFTVGDVGPGVETEVITIGDANLDNAVNTTDVGSILRYANSETTRIGQTGVKRVKEDGSSITIGDANLDNSVNTTDVGSVLRYANSETTRIGQTGTKVTVQK